MCGDSDVGDIGRLSCNEGDCTGISIEIMDNADGSEEIEDKADAITLDMINKTPILVC